MVWMITLHKGFVKSFLSGEKDIELHTSDFGIKTAPQWFREVKKGHKYIK